MTGFLLNTKLNFYCWSMLLLGVSGRACEMKLVNTDTDGGCLPFATSVVIDLPTCLELCTMWPACVGSSYNTNTSICTGYTCTSTITKHGFTFYVKDCSESSTANDASSTTTDVSLAVYTSQTALESSESSTVSSAVATSSLELSDSFVSFSATATSSLASSEPITVSPTSVQMFGDSSEIFTVSSAINISPSTSYVSSTTSSLMPPSTMQTQSSCSEVPVNVGLPKGPQVKWAEVQGFRNTMMPGELFCDVRRSILHCAVQCAKLVDCLSFFIHLTSGECCGHSESCVSYNDHLTYPASGFRYYILMSD